MADFDIEMPVAFVHQKLFALQYGLTFVAIVGATYVSIWVPVQIWKSPNTEYHCFH